jgi:hypothetical protein
MFGGMQKRMDLNILHGMYFTQELVIIKHKLPLKRGNQKKKKKKIKKLGPPFFGKVLMGNFATIN